VKQNTSQLDITGYTGTTL